MAKIIKCNKSAIRRQKQDKRKKDMNHFRLHTMKTYIKRAKAAGTVESFQIAQSFIDLAICKGGIHANRGARLKSRLFEAVCK